MSKLFSVLILAIGLTLLVGVNIASGHGAPPPPTKYAFHDGSCQLSYYGSYATKEECEAAHAVCDNGITKLVDRPHAYSYDKWVWDQKLHKFVKEEHTVTVGACVVPSAAAPVIPRVDHDFLCADKWAVNPYVLTHDEALVAFNEWGWWVPFAVLGNVEGGTNIGGYHLVCNLPSTLKAAPNAPVVDNNGVVYDSQYEADYRAYYTPALGIYKVAS